LDGLSLARFVFDTNIIRYGFLDEEYRARLLQRFSHRAISSVVLSELRRAARTSAALTEIARLEKLRPPHVFAPTRSDWVEAARFLATLIPSLPRPVTRDVRAEIAVAQNDALIAISSWSLGYTVVTTDAGFHRLVDFLPQFAGRLIIENVPPTRHVS
jgi:predicted nucleic acid-binding protein